MKWDQIETKWVLMTRRIRADLDEGCADVRTGLGRTLERRGTARPVVADTQLATLKEPESKTSTQ